MVAGAHTYVHILTMIKPLCSSLVAYLNLVCHEGETVLKLVEIYV